MDTLYTFWDNITHNKTKSLHFLGLVNSATKIGNRGLLVRAFRGDWEGFLEFGMRKPDRSLRV